MRAPVKGRASKKSRAKSEKFGAGHAGFRKRALA